MGDWQWSATDTLGGRFRVFATRLTKSGRRTEVTNVRGAPITLDSYSSGDPFGDSVAQLTIPSITPFDDLEAPDLRRWLAHYSNLDIYWVPAIARTARYTVETPVLNPLTDKLDVVTPMRLRDSGGALTATMNAQKVWEGFLTSFDFTADSSSYGLAIQCQGCLFQLDRYLQKPFYPARPWPLERLIADAFSRDGKPHLRWPRLHTVFPDDWERVVPTYEGSRGVYTPAAKPGTLWTGYTTRQTGSWERTLTGYVQDQLTVMITRGADGPLPRNQWTVLNYREGEDMPEGLSTTGATLGPRRSPGRTPVLSVRERQAAPDLILTLGTPGVVVRLTSDSTQSENVIYGEGTSLDGTGWRNAVISNNGTRTGYVPLAAERSVFPYDHNKELRRNDFVSEAYTKFGPGFDQPSATRVAAQHLERDKRPGWTGTVELSIDPPDLSRWQIHAGMILRLKQFAGSGQQGTRLHIASVEAKPSSGTVMLTVDSRFRDLLTVEESRARTRDPLTPVKMLQVGKASTMIQDVQAPWDYSAGSGFIPTAAKEFFANKPASAQFPYLIWRRKHPPASPNYLKYYVPCHAGASNSLARWAGPIPVLTSEKGSIVRTEISVCDVNGAPLKIPFHVSFYYVNTKPRSMPHYNGRYSPYINDAFEKVDPITGVQVSPLLWPDPSIIIGWGNKAGGTFNRAGFWPGREPAGADATGLFVDEGTWSYDMTQWRQYFQAANPPGSHPKDTDITIYAMFYAEHTSTVYFQGRLFRQNPGVS